MSRKTKKKTLFSYANPLLIKIGLIVGLISVFCAGLVIAGYKGIGPLDWLFSPASINLLVEDTGSYKLYQTPKQAAKNTVQGFAVNKTTGKRIKVNSVADIILEGKKTLDIPKTTLTPYPLNSSKTGDFDKTYSLAIDKVSQLIIGCQAENKGTGTALQQCLCASMDCVNNPVAKAIANTAKNKTLDSKLDCVELVSIIEQSLTTQLTGCPGKQTANSLTDPKCISTSNALCRKKTTKKTVQYPTGGFKIGDDIIIDIKNEKGGTKNDHIAICVEVNPKPASNQPAYKPGSCRVCEANNNNDGAVNCNRVIEPVNQNILAVWRKYPDTTQDWDTSANCW